ncbi:magnesium transporter [Sulfurospirillum diekertiae]|uniref:CorA family divalent cation transporter n=1 Tax=Sulfurospirillum diekertiae TaxID=1854492 RepID=UPI00142771D0|nr:CorA family divalent cation transporter [Sulfurospirillum diekertiae]QIR77495.1 magnesium transporter [Sulfurospirillum diekertiae]
MIHLYDQIDRFHLLDIKNATHPSMFVEESNYDILILALPTSRDKELKIDSYAFVFDGTSCYWYDKNVQEFIDFKTMEKVYELLNEKTNIAMKMLTSLHESIDWMEEQLYDNAQLSSFMRYWLNTKKDLSRINRLLTLSVEVLESFIESYLKEENFLSIHFKDIHEHLSRTNRSSLLAIDKLNNLYNFYTSRNNERMNKTIYLLTIFSGIFLPLNLIVGYFGMNTHGLPLDGIANGSKIVAFLLGCCAMLMAGVILYFGKKV